jgi:hypothetical protein
MIETLPRLELVEEPRWKPRHPPQARVHPGPGVSADRDRRRRRSRGSAPAERARRSPTHREDRARAGPDSDAAGGSARRGGSRSSAHRRTRPGRRSACSATSSPGIQLRRFQPSRGTRSDPVRTLRGRRRDQPVR